MLQSFKKWLPPAALFSLAISVCACGAPEETVAIDPADISMIDGLRSSEPETSVDSQDGELRASWEAEDSLGNRYRVVVRHDEATADEVAALRTALKIISEADATSQGIPSELLEGERQTVEQRALMDRPNGMYVILAYPLSDAPTAVGASITKHFGSLDATEDGRLSAQAAYDITSGTFNVNYCGTADGIICYMSGSIVNQPGENDGVLQARRRSTANSCSGGTSFMNGINYNVTGGPQYFSVYGYFFSGWNFHGKQCRIDPGSETDRMTGDLTLQTVWG